MANSLRAYTFFALLTVHALPSCAAIPAGGPTPDCPPPPLSGAALEFVRAEIAKFDGPDGPDKLFVTGGYGHAADGRKIAYDRWLNVGSLLLGDRGRAFDAFVDGARAYETMGDHGFVLTDTPCAIACLIFDRGVPPAVVEDDVVGVGEVESGAACFERQHEGAWAFKRLEVGNKLIACAA